LAVAGELTAADALEILGELFPPVKSVAECVTARSTTSEILSLLERKERPHYATL